MKSSVEKFEYKNFIITIGYDELAENPLQYDEGVKFVLFHNRYNLQNNTELVSSDYSNWNEVEKAIKKTYKPLAILPVFMLDHGSVGLSSTPFSCPFDSGQVGFAFIDKECLSEMGFDSKEAYEKAVKYTMEKDIDEYIKLYNSYLNGEVYCFDLKHKDQPSDDDSVIEALSGYYDFHEAYTDAISVADSL